MNLIFKFESARLGLSRLKSYGTEDPAFDTDADAIKALGITEADFKKGSLMLKEILETIKTMDGSYDILPGEIIEFTERE